MFGAIPDLEADLPNGGHFIRTPLTENGIAVDLLCGCDRRARFRT